MNQKVLDVEYMRYIEQGKRDFEPSIKGLHLGSKTHLERGNARYCGVVARTWQREKTNKKLAAKATRPSKGTGSKQNVRNQLLVQAECRPVRAASHRFPTISL